MIEAAPAATVEAAPSTTLFAVAGAVRSGTMWYSRLFTTDRSYCYHELTSLLQPYPTNVVLLRAVAEQTKGLRAELAWRRRLLQAYPEYFVRHWERTRFGQHIIGNSGGTLPILPALWLLWPDMKFLFSVRNGINWVQSMLAGAPPPADAPPHGTELFSFWCERWAKNNRASLGHREWLRARHADLIETRLEDITTDPCEMRRVWEWLIGDWSDYEERNLALMASPVNVRTNVGGVRSADEVWSTWAQEQRETFASTCGDMQARLGYELPER